MGAYLSEAVRTQVPWRTPPTVRVIGHASAEDVARTIRAVQLVNAALPEGAKLEVGAPLPSVSLSANVSVSTYSASGQELANTIHVEWIPEAVYSAIRGPTKKYKAAFGVTLGNGKGYIGFNRGANSYPRDNEATILLAHELLHAVADFGHVPAQFASILEGTGDIHHAGQNAQRRPLSLLYPVDREALQAFFGRLQGGSLDFGPWSSESLHIAARSPHAAFGVALRNGYAEPWAYGHLPARDLADNRALSGNATWKGDLIGLTPNRHSVWGNAAIAVALSTMTGRADFTEIVVSRSQHRAWSQWRDGDLGYTIAVRGNTFRETGGDAGRLTGIFTGRSHEGAAGTLERSDLTAAFGASR